MTSTSLIYSRAPKPSCGLLLRTSLAGQVAEAIDILEEYRPQTKNLEKA
jgi:hypothetical protein